MKFIGAHTQNGVLIVSVERRSWLFFAENELWLRNPQKTGWKDSWIRMSDGARNYDISINCDDKLNSFAALHAARVLLDAPEKTPSDCESPNWLRHLTRTFP